MNRPTDTVIDLVAPSYDVEGLPITDARSIRNVAHSEMLDTFRLPRGGPHEASLVVSKKYYDGSAGGESGHYALLFIEFKSAGSRWRTAGVKVRAVEAKRIARGLTRGVSSKPGRAEPKRVGGKVLTTDESELRGAPVEGRYVIYVRHRMRSGDWGRTLGVEILAAEATAFAVFLETLIPMSGR